jgi:hypothetical protein
MPVIAKHSHSDWCHICGKRSNRNVDVWYPLMDLERVRKELSDELSTHVGAVKQERMCGV